MASRSLYRAAGKRLLDLVLGVPALVLAAPVLGMAAVLIRLDSPGSAFFVQPRMGRGGEIFSMIKLRTMTDKPRVPDREIVAGDPEVTRLGGFLRRCKLDELPQLLNVLRGEMSLVGPRPALPEQLAEYSQLAMRRLEIRPGLTGLAQVSGDISISWPQRWAYDAEYVDSFSLGGDLRIIARTVRIVLGGDRRRAPGRVAGPERGRSA